MIDFDAHKRSILLQALSGTALGALPLAGLSQSAARATQVWKPTKPMRIVLGFPPGGLTDAYARLAADQLSSAFGVPCVVENKPGAGSVLAIDTVAKSAPDGHTLLITTSGTVWQNRVLYSKLPYNIEKDLTVVTMFPSGPLVVGINDKIPAKNIKEFVDYAKGKQLSMGTYAPGSIPQMMADQFNRSNGTQIQSIHYRGESPMWIDVVGGQVQIAVGSYQAFATVHSRGVRPIAVMGTARSQKLPDVLTMGEQGVENLLNSLEGYLPLIAPSGTPEYVLRTISDVLMRAVDSERSIKQRETFAIPNKPLGLLAARKEWDRVVPIWIKLAVDLGMKLD